MQPLLQPRLVNDPTGDPGLFVNCQFERRALLFDLGDLSRLSARELLRVSDIFLSHAHVDHLIGFDRWLRICVGRTASVRLFGPPGTIDRIGHKLLGYTWNLAASFRDDLVITVFDVDAAGGGCAASFHLREAFQRHDQPPPRFEGGVLRDEAGFCVRAVTLDHGIPCLAFAVAEGKHVQIIESALVAGGYRAGPWLRELREAVWCGDAEERPIVVSLSDADKGTRNVYRPVGALCRELVRVVPGQKFAYIVDAAGHAENTARIIDLVRDADILFIETPFLAEDKAIADAKNHLTAAAAGAMARTAGVRRLQPFHFSSRYGPHTGRLREEALRVFAGD